MATRALQQVVSYIAWNTSTNAYVTGDSANHTLYWTKDGTASVATNAAAEIDSTHLPGLYKCTMTATETDCIEGMLGGKSATSNVSLIPTMVAFDYLNTSAPAAAGVPDVNVKNMNNVAATSITAINANQGTTQPVNYTGTGASALVKSDMVDVAGSAVSASTAQLGVNVVNIAGSPSAGAAGFTAPDLTVANAIETGLTLQQALRLIASTTGAKLSGAGSGTETFRNAVADSANRVVATVDSSGNRTAITYNL